ncbi:MAG: Cys-tRNA(Pro) deacylase [Caulobacterales bacterium]|nr:Cys-tRNA(Pro) deacylase [Caulobacterales bacterium]MCA0373396.1 Cys-tRNA(Pro) deacylase [Pseudomonadota bacterium]
MAKETAGTLALKKAGIAFTPYPYEYDPNADKIGIQAANALGKAPEQVFKTLMCEVDKAPACVIIPSDCEVSMKKLAAAFGGKSANMMKPDAAERMTGFKVGGISPFGQRKQVKTFIDETAILFDEVLINGGARGLLVGVIPNDVIEILRFGLIDLVA